MKILLITGASSDLGCCYIKKYADRYDKIVGTYHSTPDALNELKADLGDKLITYSLDLNDEDAVTAFGEYLKKNELLPQYFIHLAGQKSAMTRVHQQDIEKVKDDLETSVFSVMKLFGTIVPPMQKAKFGRIVFMLSSVTHTTVAFKTSYTVAKYALLGFMKSAAVELAASGITVNGVSPTMIDTRFIKGASPLALKKSIENSPLKRLATPEEIVCVIDTKYNSMARPQISSFSIPSYDLGAVSMRVMTKMLQEQNDFEREIELSYLFTPRQTTKN